MELKLGDSEYELNVSSGSRSLCKLVECNCNLERVLLNQVFTNLLNYCNTEYKNYTSTDLCHVYVDAGKPMQSQLKSSLSGKSEFKSDDGSLSDMSVKSQLSDVSSLSEDLTPEHADTECQSDSEASEVVDADKVVAYFDRN